MERLVSKYNDYSIMQADGDSLYDVSCFVVKENYKHHIGNMPTEAMNTDVTAVYEEENKLYSHSTQIFIVRNNSGVIIGTIRVFHWNREIPLPIQKIYGINPLLSIHSDAKYNYWHVGRFAVDSFSGVSTFSLFKQLMALAVRPIVSDENSYMIAEIDSKLLRVMNALDFVTEQLGKSVYYLESETVPICSSKKGVMGFYSKYGQLPRVG